MTAQLPDLFALDGEIHHLAGARGHGLFGPEDHGFAPSCTTTCCWRGYVATYTVLEGRLVLDRLRINNGSWQGGEYRCSPPPAFGGRAPIPQEPGSVEFDLQYAGIALPVAFTGGILIARDFIADLQVHMGFQPAWKYRQVNELIFDDGALVSRMDVSDKVGADRERILQEAGRPADAEHGPI